MSAPEAHIQARCQHARGLLRRLHQLVDLVEEGVSDRDIGERFGWSETTVKRHRAFLGALKREQGRRGKGRGRWREVRP